MASIQPRDQKHPEKGYYIQYRLCGKKKKFSLGKMTKTQAEQRFLGKFEELIRRQETGFPISKEVEGWLKDQPKEIIIRLEDAGLLPKKTRITCKELWNAYLEDLKIRERVENTISTMEEIEKRFFNFFLEDTDPNQITLKDGNDFRQFLASEGNNGNPYAQATIAATIVKTRCVFKFGVKRKLLTENIFADVYAGSQENHERIEYIPPEVVAKVLEYSPDQYFRAFFALLRIGGLRFSEAVYMKWEDVNLVEGVLYAENRKTGRKTNRPYRVIAITEDLRRELEDLQEISDDGEEYLFPKYASYPPKSVNQNLRKIMVKVLKLAGIPQWERLFQNNRASRDNEVFSNPNVADHIAEQMMGHSKKMAKKHYLKLTPQNIEVMKRLSVLNG